MPNDAKPIRLRTQVLRSAPKPKSEPGASATGDSPVDREGGDYGAGLIRGVSVMTAGECLGHDCLADNKTLEKIVELGNTNKNGTKVRFTHPSLSADGTGKLMARGKNFALDGEQVRADVHFLASAHNTPHGDLAGYTLDLAEESPDLVGTSVVVEYRLEKQVDAAGKQQRNDAGEPLLPFLRPTRLWAFDLVDEPAANPGGLFNDDSMPDAAARQASAMLDLLFGDLPPADTVARVNAFMQRYFATKGQTMPTATDQKPPADKPEPGASVTGVPADFSADVAGLSTKIKAAADAGQLNDDAIASLLEPFAAFKAKTPGADASGSLINDEPADDELRAELQKTKAEFSEKLGECQKLNERKRCTKITAMCKLAGLEKLAAGFIGNDATIDEVSEALVKQLAHKNKSVGDLNSDDPAEKKPDPNAAFKKEYAGLDPKFKRGVTEEQYVRTCRIDAGLESLTKEAE